MRGRKRCVLTHTFFEYDLTPPAVACASRGGRGSDGGCALSPGQPRIFWRYLRARLAALRLHGLRRACRRREDGGRRDNGVTARALLAGWQVVAERKVAARRLVLAGWLLLAGRLVLAERWQHGSRWRGDSSLSR